MTPRTRSVPSANSSRRPRNPAIPATALLCSPYRESISYLSHLLSSTEAPLMLSIAPTFSLTYWDPISHNIDPMPDLTQTFHLDTDLTLCPAHTLLSYPDVPNYVEPHVPPLLYQTVKESGYHHSEGNDAGAAILPSELAALVQWDRQPEFVCPYSDDPVMVIGSGTVAGVPGYHALKRNASRDAAGVDELNAGKKQRLDDTNSASSSPFRIQDGPRLVLPAFLRAKDTMVTRRLMSFLSIARYLIIALFWFTFIVI